MYTARRLRWTDDGAVSIWVIVAIVVVIAIILVAALMVEADSPDMNAPDEDTKYQLAVSYKFSNSNYPGGIWVAPENSRVFTVSVEDFDYDAYRSSSHVYFSFKPFGIIHGSNDNKFEYTLQLRVTGPNSFEAKDKWKLEYEIGEGNTREINFGTKYCYLQESGTYRVEAKLWVDAPAEDLPFSSGLDNALIWTHSRTVTAGGGTS